MPTYSDYLLEILLNALLGGINMKFKHLLCNVENIWQDINAQKTKINNPDYHSSHSADWAAMMANHFKHQVAYKLQSIPLDMAQAVAAKQLQSGDLYL